MTQIEKIKAEIERLEETECSFANSDQRGGFYDALESILSFIESLEHEPSLPAGLDEAAEEYEKYAMEDYDEICVNADGSEVPCLRSDFRDAFKAGAEWMAGQGQTEVLTVESPLLGPPMICCPVKEHKNGDKVIVQIRKKP